MSELHIMDLCSGCGGLSLGFEEAGFIVDLAIEKDAVAAETYQYNHKNTKVIVGNIAEIVDFKGLNLTNYITGIVAGVPCQGFSISGKRDKNDPRNSLFMDFIRFVDYYKPSFCLIENVKGILSMKTKTNELVKDIIVQELNKIGYDVFIQVLNAANFGVPQKRERVFFIGFRKDLGVDTFNVSSLVGEKDFITVEQAIMDLPQIKAKEGSEQQEYRCEPQNDYQKLVRKNSNYVYNHIAMKHSDRIVKRFELIKFGQSVGDLDDKDQQRKEGTKRISYNQNNYRPYPDRPNPTLPASFQSNFVHPYLNRNYTAREGARIQSFPDTYIFKGKRINMSWDIGLSQYHQIGNAVPPLLAKGIAEQIKMVLDVV